MHRFISSAATRVYILLILMIVIGHIGYNAYTLGGLGFRLPGYEFEKYVKERMNESFGAYGSAQQYIDQCDFIYAKKDIGIAARCYTKDPQIANQVLLWGDSYAQMLTYGLLKNLPANWQLFQVASRGCQASIFEAVGSEQNYCKQSNFFAMKTIAQEKPKVVIVSQNSELNSENAQLITRKLHHLGVSKVIFVGKPPEWAQPLPKLVFRSMPEPTPAQSKKGLLEEVVNKGTVISNASLQLSNNDEYLNLINMLCSEHGCQVFLGEGKELGITALDDRHLTPAASHYVASQVLVREITLIQK